MKQPLVGVLGIACASLAALSTVLWASASPPSASAQEEPAEVVDAFIDAVNAHDGDAAAAFFAESGVFAEILTESFAAVGQPAIAFIFQDLPLLEIEVTLTNVQTNVDTGVVTGVARISDADTEAAGVDRYLEDFTIAVNDAGEITSVMLIADEGDADTRAYIEYLEAHEEPGEDDEEPAFTEIELGPGRDGSQTGTAFLTSEFVEPGLTFVGIQIEPGAAGVLQPAHLHDGDCPGVGAIASPLASVLDGGSASIISMSEDEVLGGNFAINVHLSEAQAAVYVACGEVGAAAAQPTAVATPSGSPGPAPTATRPSGIGAPDTGSGPADGGGSSVWLLAALAALGASLAGAGLATARQRSSRG